ncbi:MAG TPA: hypothetical protein VMV31_03890 [Terriglobales bacterium]|nr:hypothetical protein [Terriglobales bacterium]
MPKPLRFALVLLVAAAVAYVLYASLHSARYRVEVCLSYHGLSACRIAEGRTRAEALRAAHDNACSQITSGVTGTLGCQDTPATRITDLN